MWSRLGIARSAAGLDAARAALDAMAAARPAPGGRAERELANMLLVGRLMAAAAMRREESRGAHFRTDFPRAEPAWRRRIDIRTGRTERG
jgi:L-aspartate oxidase